MTTLNGFEFNLNGKLGSTLFTPFSTDLDRVTGDVELSLAPFAPKVRIAAPGGTTHFKVVMGAAELDFANEASVFESTETAILPYDAQNTAAIDLSVTLTENTVLPILQVVGVEFYQQVNGQMYSLKNGTYNALSVAQADKV